MLVRNIKCIPDLEPRKGLAILAEVLARELEGVAVLFAFPLAVEAADGSVIEAAPEDFVVTCDAVKVAGPEPVLDAPCEAMAALQMTPEGVLMTFRGVDLCPGCWLVGGANGWFFSVAHRAGLPFAPMAPQPPQCPA